MNSAIHKWLMLYPIHYLRGEPVLERLRQVGAVERMNEVELGNFQNKKLCHILNLGMKQGVYSDFPLSSTDVTVNTAKRCLSLLPLHSKTSIRKVHSRGYSFKKFLEKRSTSGSTGEPLNFKKGRVSTSYMDAAMYRAYQWHGIEPGEAQARFWGVPAEGRARIVSNVKDFIKNRKRLSAFSLDSASMLDFFADIEKLRPTSFYGYPSLIYEFACFLKERCLSISFPMKAIIGTGEYVDQSQIAVIEDVFATKFVNEYGCTEVGIIGLDCPDGSMHLMAHNIYIEVIKDGLNVVDEEGDIYVTELNSDYLPFIRYSTGDRGMLLSRKCSCGSSFPLIQVLAGRQDDYIQTPEGNRVYDAVLAYTFKKGVLRFKAYQRSVDQLDILIVPQKDKFPEALLSQYQQTLKDRVSKTMSFNITLVEDIPREKSGKLRYFKSELSS